MEVSGVLGNFTAVLATQTLKLYWSTLEIKDYSKHPSMIIQTQDNPRYEAPRFIAGSSHKLLSGFGTYGYKSLDIDNFF